MSTHAENIQANAANLAEHWRLIAGGCAIAGDDEGTLEALNTAIALTPDATNLVRLRDRILVRLGRI